MSFLFIFLSFQTLPDQNHCYFFKREIMSFMFIFLSFQTLPDQNHCYFFKRGIMSFMFIFLSFQTLPDQNHCYFFNGLNGVNGSSPALSAVMVSRIPFTHPTNVPQILNFLRQQLLFNTLIGSCVKTNPKKGKSRRQLFYLLPLSNQC